MKKSIPKVGLAFLLTGSLAVVASWGDEPIFLNPMLPGEVIAQGKTDPKDKDKEKDKDKFKNKDKDKEKKQPEVALDRPLIFPEGRLDFIYRNLPPTPEMLGDQPPVRVRDPRPRPRPVVPPGGGARAAGGGGTVPTGDGSFFFPGTRGFKVADNGSPRPQDRVYFGFQYYDDLYGASNRAINAQVGNIGMYREYIGLEKTFLDGAASLDFRLPLNTLNVNGGENLSGNHTALGDLGMAFRYALWRDVERDRYLTAGLALTAPTGSSTAGGIDMPIFAHSVVLQPFVGYLWRSDDLFIQGFSAIDIPTDSRDVTLWYNDICVGYFVYRTPDASRFVTAFAPAFEVHIANPLNHRSSSDPNDPVAFADSVNLGAVGNFDLRNRARLSAGVVTPVTGPQPFSVEGILQLRFRY